MDPYQQPNADASGLGLFQPPNQSTRLGTATSFPLPATRIYPGSGLTDGPASAVLYNDNSPYLSSCSDHTASCSDQSRSMSDLEGPDPGGPDDNGDIVMSGIGALAPPQPAPAYAMHRERKRRHHEHRSGGGKGYSPPLRDQTHSLQ
ncbi:hypothetical protein KIPB_013141, partial [Kipferlia bialata]|eukprot:g13141.t1